MSKYLDLSGLSHYTEKITKHFDDKYTPKGKIIIGDTTIDDKTVSINSTSGNVEMSTTDNASVKVMGTGGNVDINPGVVKITSEDGVISRITGKSLNIGGLSAESGTVTATKFVKSGSDKNHVLLGNGDDLEMNVENGILRLDENGLIDSSFIPLDTTVFEVVSELPKTDITNRIYLVKTGNESQNMYSEYIYTGDYNGTYDASKWEKLGDFRSEIDLTDYSKKINTISNIADVTSDVSTATGHYSKADGTSGTYRFPIATKDTSGNYKAGIMTGNDKKVLDTLAGRYPLSISGISASPNLVEVGVAADVTFSWSIANEDFHPVSSQSISVAGGAAHTVAVGTKSYKQTALAGATTATTKSATVTIKSGSTTLTKDVAVTYHYPTYIGVMANGATVNETSVKALAKSIEWGKGKKTTLTQNNQIIVYAYPASYGDLTSVKDGNGFEGFAGYTKQTMTIGGQSYNVYVQNIAATSSSTYTFA